MIVYVVEEINHGIIFVVSSVRKAVEMLIEYNWLYAAYNVYDIENDTWVSISELLGKDWIEIISNFSLAEFSEFFEDQFYLHQYEVDKF